MNKEKIPKIKKQEIWHYYIGEEIGKTKCLCCSINFITQFDFHCGHIEAKSCGGDLSLENLRPICAKCNLSMGNENMIGFMQRLKYNISKIINKDILANQELEPEPKPKQNHVWSESDDSNVYLCYRFPNKYNLETMSNTLDIPLNSVKMKISNYKSLENNTGLGLGLGLSNCSKQSIDIYNKYKNCCLEQILNLPLEIKFVLRQNQWGVSKNVYDTIKQTKKLICPWAHTKKICELFNESKWNDKKFYKIFINDISLNDYVLVVDRDYKTGLIVKIISQAKTESIDDIIILRQNNLCSHIPITDGHECELCHSSMISVFTKKYFKENVDEFLVYLNEDYHFEKMHSIIRDIEIIGEIPNINVIYQKYKCLQGSICSTKDKQEVSIKDIEFNKI